MEKANIDPESQPVVVLFNLETAEFWKNPDIIQIAAKRVEKNFSMYIKPTKTNCEDAQRVTGLTFSNEILLYHN